MLLVNWLLYVNMGLNTVVLSIGMNVFQCNLVFLCIPLNAQKTVFKLCFFIERVVQKPGLQKQQIDWMIEEKEKKKVTEAGCNGYLVFDEMAIQVSCAFFSFNLICEQLYIICKIVMNAIIKCHMYTY